MIGRLKVGRDGKVTLPITVPGGVAFRGDYPILSGAEERGVWQVGKRQRQGYVEMRIVETEADRDVQDRITERMV